MIAHCPPLCNIGKGLSNAGGRDFWKGKFIRLMLCPAVIPAVPYRHFYRTTIIPAAPLPSFPRKRESGMALPYNAASPASHRRIPAYAGMTVRGR